MFWCNWLHDAFYSICSHSKVSMSLRVFPFCSPSKLPIPPRRKYYENNSPRIVLCNSGGAITAKNYVITKKLVLQKLFCVIGGRWDNRLFHIELRKIYVTFEKNSLGVLLRNWLRRSVTLAPKTIPRFFSVSNFLQGGHVKKNSPMNSPHMDYVGLVGSLPQICARNRAKSNIFHKAISIFPKYVCVIIWCFACLWTEINSMISHEPCRPTQLRTSKITPPKKLCNAGVNLFITLRAFKCKWISKQKKACAIIEWRIVNKKFWPDILMCSSNSAKLQTQDMNILRRTCA